VGEAAERSRVRYLRLPRRRRARARVPLKKFAMLETTMLILALVEFQDTVVGERRVVGARRSAGDELHLVELVASRPPSTHDAPFALNGSLERARRPSKIGQT